MTSIISATGAETGPGADAAITTIAAASLPRGLYDVVVVATFGGTLTAATERNNMKVVAGTTELTLPIPGSSPNNPGAVLTTPPLRVRLDGQTAITVRSIGAATGTAVYIATIIATPVGYGGS